MNSAISELSNKNWINKLNSNDNHNIKVNNLDQHCRERLKKQKIGELDIIDLKKNLLELDNYNFIKHNSWTN